MRSITLAGELDEMGAFQRALGEEDAVVGQDRHRVAPDPREAGDQRRSVQGFELVDLMVSHPDLIQRPIVEKGARAILARPAERLKEIL